MSVHRLYAAEVSLYSGKARAYLRYKQVDFQEVLPSLRVIREVLEPRTGARMIPVLITEDDEAIQDTTVIIDRVEQLVPERPVFPQTPRQRFIAQLLELYADEWLLMPAMHYRWAYPRHHLAFIAREFGALFQPEWPEWSHLFAGLPLVVYFGLGHGPVLGIDRKTRVEIERWYERFLARFERHLVEYDYVLGGAPTVADFGFMAPLYAHLWRDPYSGALMRRLAPRVYDWVERMNDPGAQQFGALAPDDSIPETLAPILRHALHEHLPIVLDTWARIGRWSREHPDEVRLPRFVGRHVFRLGASQSTRAVQSYTAWMSQRTFDAWRALGEADRQELRDWLGGGLVAPLDFERPFDLEHRRGRIMITGRRAPR